MKNDVMGIIYTSKDDLSLRELTSQRAVAAIPVAGRYRIIDFTLSSMVNSGIHNVGIIAQKNYQSLMDHLGSGKDWDLHTRNNGLFFLPPFMTRDNSGEYNGLLDALRSNFDYLRRSEQDFVILTDSDYAMNTTFDAMIQQHIKSRADITMMYQKATAVNTEFSTSSNNNHVFLDVNGEGAVTNLEVNPNAASFGNLFLSVMMVKRTLLIYLVDQAISRGSHDLYADVLLPAIQANSLKIMGYEEKGYYRRIETIRGYFNFSLDLLKPEVREALFGANPVFTKTRDSVPTIYRAGAKVTNSLIADGCVIDGEVENCVLSRGVRVGKGAKVKNCVIMQDSYIEDDVELENVIFDKAVTIRSHGRLIGQAQYPIVIGKNITL
ncbi:MAG: glucose-1-phosphate adenylyltransferase subunit GlgD [Clostridia bacterium]|nr:glucose-1-phosphate adenylyltransferase subunit GlgD [Clostridia bacterium]